MTPAVLRWLVRDVFRQARATGLLATLLAITALGTLICLTTDFLPDEAATDGRGTLTVMFGSVTIVTSESVEQAAHQLQFLLAAGVADTLGVLLTLMWTAGFLPSFLDSASVSVLLAKPVPRAALFVGKFVGVVLFVGLISLVFVTTTALALGLRTGVWGAAYWLCVPVLLLHFGVFFSFSSLIAVMTRNTAACVVGSLLFWILCWAMNYGRHTLVSVEPTEATAALSWSAELGYWLLPKPADFGLILSDTVGADRFSTTLFEFRQVKERGLFHPIASVITSLAFGAVILLLAANEFVNEDY
jgi:ABC-type transport system involved in multi-copper enzyme maturation permease subunit